MPVVYGFPAISHPDARILILGSMPGRESLAQQRYYAHPRNAFWPILCDLFQIKETEYRKRCEQLTHKGVAVWDVLQACFRSGSLDADIDNSTIVTNNFEQFFFDHPGISRIFFNGAKAESVYRKHVLQGLGNQASKLSLQRLPSTSPAYAGMSLERKKEAWRVILDFGFGNH